MAALYSVSVSAGTFRLLALAWGVLTLGLLGQAVRNGHYVPVPGKPRLCLDTRTGEYHLARMATTLLDEAEVAEEAKTMPPTE